MKTKMKWIGIKKKAPVLEEAFQFDSKIARKCKRFRLNDTLTAYDTDLYPLKIRYPFAIIIDECVFLASSAGIEISRFATYNEEEDIIKEVHDKDYIVREFDGELSAYSPALFKALYDIVESDEK